MNLNNLKIVHKGLDNNIVNSSAVMVLKKPGDINIVNISDYLSQYAIEETRKAELVSRDGNGINRYLLEDNDLKEFNLMIFVCNKFSILDEIEPSSYGVLGYLELPKMGVKELDPTLEIKLNFNYVPVGEQTELEVDLSNDPEYKIKDYYTKDKSSTEEMLEKNSIHNYGIDLVNSDVSRPNSITYIPNGILSDGNIYEIPRLKVDTSDIVSHLIDTTYISYNNNEYVTYEFDDVKYLRNETLATNNTLSDLTNPETIRLDYEVQYKNTILMPDWIAWKVNNWKYVSADYFRSQGFTKISEVAADPNIVSVQSDLAIGIDRVSNDINMIFSNPSQDEWFYQSKLNYLLHSNEYLQVKYTDYTVVEHNLRFYIIKERSEGRESYTVVDYKGNKRLNFVYYKLLIDGSCILKIDGRLMHFSEDLTNFTTLGKREDIYKVYPGATPLIIESSGLDISKAVILRDRIQII